MNFNWKPGILACTLQLSLINAFAAGAHPFTLRIDSSSSSSTVAAGDEIQIHVTLTNLSNHGISATRSSLSRACHFMVEVKGPNGLRTNEPGCGGSHSLSFIPLMPGESIDGNITLTNIYKASSGEEDLVSSNKIFDFSEPGVYVVQVSRVDLEDPDLGYVASNKLVITIVPNNDRATWPSGHLLSLTISADDRVFKVGSPVLVQVVLTNVSGEAMTVPWSADPQHLAEQFAIAVRNDRGDMAKVSSSDWKNEKSLGPGERIEGDCIVRGEPLDFGTPGKYQIQFFMDEHRVGDEWSLKSNKITISVYK